MSGEWRQELVRIGEKSGIDAVTFLRRVEDEARRAQASSSAPEGCPVCGLPAVCDGTRFVDVRLKNGRVEKCPNFEEYDREQRVRQAQEQAGISERHRECTLDGFFPPTRQAEAAVLAVREYVASWSEMRARGEGLYLWGPVGTGKTHLAYAAANTLITERGARALAVRALDVFGQLRRGYGRDEARATETERYWTTVLEAPLLLLDDLGVSKPSEWIQEQTYAILDERYRAQRPTIITANEPPDRLAGRIGERAVSRIHEMCRVVRVPGEDVRRLMAEARDGRR